MVNQTSKYRLVCFNRCVFIVPTDIKKITLLANGHYSVDFKDPSLNTLRIRKNTCQRLLLTYPFLSVT